MLVYNLGIKYHGSAVPVKGQKAQELLLADPEHVALAKSGVSAINRWRELTFRTPNLNVPRFNLQYRLADRAASETFEPEYIYGRPALHLSGAMLSGAKLAGADLSHDDLSRADLTQSNLRMADLSGANLQSVHLWRSNLSHSNLNEALLSGASLGRTNLANSSLRGADARGIDLSHSDLSYADLEGANLSGANLSEADFSWANLANADLRSAQLSAASFKMANLSGADLRGAKFTKTNLESAVFFDAVLGFTIFANCDLSLALGLESVKHAGPSTIALDTLSRSGGMLPESFLRGAGVAEPLVAAQEAVKGSNRAYPTVLLVGSISDGEFAKKLMDGLAQWQIRSWTIAADDEAALHSGTADTDSLVYYDRIILLCTSQSLENPLTSRFFAELVRGLDADSGGAFISIGADELFYQRKDRLCTTLKKGQVVDFNGWQNDATYQSAIEILGKTLTETAL